MITQYGEAEGQNKKNCSNQLDDSAFKLNKAALKVQLVTVKNVKTVPLLCPYQAPNTTSHGVI